MNLIDVFTVTAYRCGSNSTHHYLVGVYSTLALAEEAANIEENYRAGKYRCEIQVSRLDHCSPESSMPNMDVASCKELLKLTNWSLNVN